MSTYNIYYIHIYISPFDCHSYLCRVPSLLLLKPNQYIQRSVLLVCATYKRKSLFPYLCLLATDRIISWWMEDRYAKLPIVIHYAEEVRYSALFHFRHTVWVIKVTVKGEGGWPERIIVREGHGSLYPKDGNINRT